MKKFTKYPIMSSDHSNEIQLIELKQLLADKCYWSDRAICDTFYDYDDNDFLDLDRVFYRMLDGVRYECGESWEDCTNMVIESFNDMGLPIPACAYNHRDDESFE